MGRQELADNVESVLVGVMADSKAQSAKRGKHANSVGEEVQLVAVERTEGIEQISAVTTLNGVEYEKVMGVEAAVVLYKQRWLPWQTQGGAAEPTTVGPAYDAEVPQRLFGA